MFSRPLPDEFAVILLLCTMNICFILLISTMVYGFALISIPVGIKIGCLLWSALWSVLTPGYQWLELAMLASSVFASTMILLTTNEICSILDAKIKKLNAEISDTKTRNDTLEKTMDTVQQLSEIN